MTAKFRALLAVLLVAPAGSGVIRAQDVEKKAANLQELRIQDEKVLTSAPSAGFRGGRGQLPNIELPAHIPAPDGEFTFFADFGSSDPKGVPLFLVNRTGKAINFESQDSDPGLKLEYLDEQGHWKRAQVHIGSDCGNSYYAVTLFPGQHFHFFGYRPTEGKPATVRYRSNSPMVSNVGQGFVIPEDISAAKLDDLAAMAIPRGLREVLQYTRSFANDESVPPAKYAAALKLLSKYGDNAYYRREAKRYVEAAKPDQKETSLISAVLDTQWPAESDPLSLFKFALSDASEMTGFPDLKWGVIRDLLEDPELERTDPAWRPSTRQAYAMLPAALKSFNNAEVVAAASVLAIPWATDEHAATSDLRGWLEHGNPAVVTSCANGLSRRQDWQWMAAKGMHLSPEAKITILKAMANGGLPESGNLRNPDFEAESVFWKHCAAEYPIMTVDALQFIGLGVWNHNNFNMSLHEPLRNFLEKEADLMESNPVTVTNEAHGYPVAQVARFVGAWKRAEDVPLFRRLLKHPGFQGGIGTDDQKRRFEFRRLRVREETKFILQSMGVFVGDEVVLEEKIPLPPE